jgi:3-phosphoglycerate kinase
LSRSYEKNEDILKPIFINLAEKLHRQFSAKRTIMDWAPECQGFVLEEEIKRLQNNDFDGEYEILDIRENSN